MTGKRWTATAGLMAALFFAPLAVGSDPFTAMGAPRLAAPHPAPAFTLPGTDGGKVSLESLRGKAILLYFGASW